MLIGYTAFRNLSMGKTIKEKSIRDDLCLCLQVISEFVFCYCAGNPLFENFVVDYGHVLLGLL